MAEPAVNPEMIIVTLVAGEHWIGRLCPNCVHPFGVGESVFESADQRTAIHVTCVIALALVATLQTEPNRTH